MTQTISPFVAADYNPLTELYTVTIDECLKCGRHQEHSTYDDDLYYRMRELGFCDDCTKWYDLFNRQQFVREWWRKVVAKGYYYDLHLEDKRKDGRQSYLFLSDNGSRAVTYNLQMVGKIPALWLPLFPDNARFIPIWQQDEWYFEDPNWPAQPYRKPVF